jgi:hypothetical protein
MALAPLTMLATDDAIGSFQARPVRFGSCPVIQMTLQEASEEFSPLLLKELLHLTMLKLLRAYVRDACEIRAQPASQ